MKNDPKRKNFRHEWRELFDSYTLIQGQKQLSKDNIYEASTDETRRYLRCYVGSSKYAAFRVTIGPAPQLSTESWEKDTHFECTCAAARKKNYWGFQNHCQHMAAAMLYWEKKHGPWTYEETDEEMAIRLEKERREEEERRQREIIRQNQERLKKIREEKIGNKMSAREYLRRKKYIVSGNAYYDVITAAKDLKTNQFYTELADIILPKGKEGLKSFVVKEKSSVNYNEEGQQELRYDLNWAVPVEAADDDRSAKGDVELRMTYEKITKVHCSCGKTRYTDDYYSYYYGNVREMCQHSLCALAALADYIERENPGDYTDKAALDLFKALDSGKIEIEEMISEEPEEKEPVIMIAPRITYDGVAPKLSFKVGKSGRKTYVLRNMQDFADALVSEETFTLGKSDQIDFKTMGLTPEGEKWMQFISRKVADTRSVNDRLASRSRWGYGTTSLSVQSQEELKGAMLDRFYDLMEGGSCEYQNKEKGISGEIRVGHVPVRVQLTCEPLRKNNGEFAGAAVKGIMPSLMKGSQNHQQYCLSDTYLTRLTEEERRALMPFQKLSHGQQREISFTVGKDRLQEFFYRVLPGFQENPCIEVTDNCSPAVEQILPPPPQFQFRMDYENEILTLHEIVKYGQTSIELPSNVTLSDRTDTNTAGIPCTDNANKTITRDTIQEQRVEKVIRLFFDKLEKDGRCYVSMVKEEGMYRILNEAVPTLSRYGTVLGTDAFNSYKIRPVPQVHVGVSVESGLMDLTVLSKDIDIRELLDLMESYRRKKKFHRLKSGEFVALTSQEQTKSLAELSQIMEELDLSQKDIAAGHKQMPVYRALYVNRLLEEHEALAGSRDRTFRQLIRNMRTVADSEYEPTAQMADVLRPYQAYGYKWLRTLHELGFGAILADEMGLGKTLQMIAVFQALKQEQPGKIHLVVCPASLVYNWQEEIERFAPDLNCCVIAGTAAARKKILASAADGSGSSNRGRENTSAKAKKGKNINPEAPDVYVTSYDLLKKDIVLYEDLRFDIVVLDEAQFIKNQKAAVTKAVKILSADHRFALTGTPIENRLAELWSIFDFLMPGYLYNYETFANRFETPIVKNKDEAMTERLKKMVGPFILRRRKEDVLKDLPEKLEEIRYARFEEEQQKLYDAQVIRMKEMLSGGSTAGEDKIKIFAELTRIRQICCDPGLLFENYKGTSAKREACIDLIKSAIDGGHRMLVFSQFTSMLELLAKDLQKEGIEYYTITGATPKEQRIKLVHQFNEEDKVPVFLISLKAGGTGLNLVGADVVIHYDPWWNLAVQNQATDRAHRIGQTRQVSVFKLIGKDTIEERIVELQEAKKDLADAILSGENQSLMSLSNEELLELLG